MSRRVGVLVMAHGTPASSEGIETFYTRIRRGRPPSAEQLADLVRRYDAIGGLSPLTARTRAQVDGLAANLEARQPGRYRVEFGAKHTEPSIEDATGALATSGVAGVVGIVLTPHRSARGSEEYLERAGAALGATGASLPFVRVEQWFDAPGLPELLGERVTAALVGAGPDPTVLFSAHSVPELGGARDPYEEQVRRSAALVAEAADLDAASVPWAVAFQSAGRTEGRWLGPSLLETLDRLAEAGRRSAVVCPIGFVSDHLEVLFDLDLEASRRAADVGLVLSRTESLNDDPGFLDILAGVVVDAAGVL